MFRMINRSTAVGLAAVLGLAAASVPASARSIIAFAGRAQNPADAGCFGEWFGTLTNGCSTARGLIEPLVIDAAGNYTVIVTAYGATPGNNVGCAAFGINKETTVFWGGAYSYLPTFGAAADLTLTTFAPFPGGAIYAACTVNSGGRVDVINWYQ